ncbi:MAG: UbiA family prenyltransferase [Thermoplasmata archaeon]|nr:UbiA family prenyltransferase [Thermoplasmata archaeon]RLF28132.1 MAG: prenyltransferase [Thermoplasmata archaeon]
MKRLKAVWELMRLEHGVMLFVAVFVGAVVGYGGLPGDLVKLFLAFLTALFLEAATFSLNDYFDIEIDRRNNRVDRPLVRGDVQPRTAVVVFVLLFPLGIVSAFFVNLQCFVIALMTGLFAVAYDAWLKRVKQVGNLYIAYTMAVPFVFGAVAVSYSVPFVVWVLAFIAFLVGFGREIMKDVMDMKGDSESGVKSIPMYVGERNAYRLSGVFYLVAVVLSFLPFFFLRDSAYYGDWVYLCLIVLTDVVFIVIAFNLFVRDNPPVRRYRMFTLVAMVFGLLAFLGGAFLQG